MPSSVQRERRRYADKVVSTACLSVKCPCYHHHLRVSASDDENVCLEVIRAVQRPCRRPEQFLILCLQVQVLEGGAQDPDLPLRRIAVKPAFNWQEYHFSPASRSWRACPEGNPAIDEVLWA